MAAPRYRQPPWWREILDWTWADVRALPRYWTWKLRERFVRLLVDCLEQPLLTELAIRQMFKRARESGADIYCPTHDCDWRHCPPECHPHDGDEKAN